MLIVVAMGVFIVAFLIGSIPFGIVVSKGFYNVDLRDCGSGNIGATNAIRVLGKKAGIAVFVLDALKGALATGLALVAGVLWTQASGDVAAEEVFAMQNAMMCWGFFAVVLGHCFSPWLNWNGGKGIAAAGGGLFVVLGPLGGIAELAIFGLCALVTRYASVGSLAAAWALVPFSLVKYLLAAPAGQDTAWVAFVLCCLTVLTVTWAHRANIKRLIAGTENRFGSKDSPAADAEVEENADDAHPEDAVLAADAVLATDAAESAADEGEER